jgi:hypothetical protein
VFLSAFFTAASTFSFPRPTTQSLQVLALSHPFGNSISGKRKIEKKKKRKLRQPNPVG